MPNKISFCKGKYLLGIFFINYFNLSIKNGIAFSNLTPYQ